MFFPPAHRPESVRAELHACEELGVSASFSVDLLQLSEATPTSTEHFEHAFVTIEVAPKPKEAPTLEYALDPILAGALIIMLSPLLALAALSSPSAWRDLCCSCRSIAGLYGRPFRMSKLRAVQRGAAAQQSALRPMNAMSGPVFKLHDDPRVTPLGRWLRRTSLDELPQLFNVLTGRSWSAKAAPLSEQAEIHGWQRRRLTMKTGLTCLWQVSGRSDTDSVDWMLLDLKYIQD